MRTSFNPILPLNEYIPDGEPHVFGDRIYLFGSHDKEGADRYCAYGNYVGWSAPLSDPGHWTCSGEIYSASQDPCYDASKGDAELYAPDVMQGNDGRYYLYYCFGGASGHSRIGVAVCDTPDGRYTYYGQVQNPDGTLCHDYLMGDPAVINDDGTLRLYCGWSLSLVAAGAHAQGKGTGNATQQQAAQEQPSGGAAQQAAQGQTSGGAAQQAAQGQTSGGAAQQAAQGQTSGGAAQQAAQGQRSAFQLPQPGDPQMNIKMAPVYQMLFHRSLDDVKDLAYPLMGANTYELDDDMITVKKGPFRIVAGQFDTPKDSSFYGHAFYEASSIRKIKGTYYFIYSSENSNELCYATSAYPDHGFVYGGTIISNGDVGYHGRTGAHRTNQTANDHGSLACINGQWYIFHHRQTHKCTFDRQACAEPVTIHEDGSIDQVECTSMGFGGVIETEGTIPAVVSCVLTDGAMPHITNTALDTDIPNITNDGDERFITGIRDGVTIGYKYLRFTGPTRMMLTVRPALQSNQDAEGVLTAYAVKRGTIITDEAQVPSLAEASASVPIQLRVPASEGSRKAAIEDKPAQNKEDQKPLPGSTELSSKEWSQVTITLDVTGEQALYLVYTGRGEIDLKDISF